MDTNQWHGLLQACTGSKLNIKKCFISEVKFEYNQSGNLTFRPHHQDDPAITLTHTNGTREPLKYTKSNKGICHLRVWISMDRNQKEEGKILQQRCLLFKTVYNKCPITRAEAWVIYKMIVLPTITYPLPTTNMDENTLNGAQLSLTPTILSKMGFNWNVPKAVVYAPVQSGSIGFQHLYSEQGTQQVLQMLKHLHSQTTLGKMLQLAIDAFQIAASIENHILQDTQPLLWMPAWWVSNIWSYLH